MRYIIHPYRLSVASHRRHGEVRPRLPVRAFRLAWRRDIGSQSVTKGHSLGDQAGDPVADYRNMLVALWAARRLGLSALQTLRYARDLFIVDRQEPGFGDVARKVAADLRRAGLDACEREVRRQVLAAQHAVLRKMLSPA